MPIRHRRSFPGKRMPSRRLRGIRPNFSGLSPCGGQVAYVLLTSAPVAVRSVATPTLPLDLHVLSLSLAFILSQDQTLRCVYRLSSFFLCERRHPLGRASPRPYVTPHWDAAIPLPRLAARTAGRQGRGRGALTCHLGILTGDPRNPFLVSHLLVRFPHRKHVNDQCPPATRALRTGRQKNRSTRNGSS